MRDALLVAIVFLFFGGLSCHDDDDCHTHVACCGGITVIRHCHSGGGSGHTHPGYDPAAQVAVLATDAPDEAVRSLYVTVNEITLESGEAHPQALFRSETGHRLDLLALRGSEKTRLYDLLAAPSLVHGATYDSIWISMADPTIVFASGEVVEAEDIELDGAIDVVFREPVPIGSDETVFLVLDVDVKRSLSWLEPDDTGSEPASEDRKRWRFRPLIFARAVREEVSEEILTPTDVEGTIDELDAGGETFDLDLPDGRGSVTAHVHRETVMLGPELKRTTFDQLHLGQTVRVRGHWRPDGGLDAQSVVEGSTLLLAGRVESVDRGSFVVSIASEDNIQETMRIEATRDSLLSFGRLGAAEIGHVEAGREVSVVAYRSSTPDTVPTAALLDLKHEPATSTPVVRADRKRWPRVDGEVRSIDREERTVVLETSGGDERVQVPPGSEILFLERTDGVLWQTPMHFEQIRAGMKVGVERLPGDGNSPELFVFHLRGEAPGRMTDSR